MHVTEAISQFEEQFSLQSIASEPEEGSFWAASLKAARIARDLEVPLRTPCLNVANKRMESCFVTMETHMRRLESQGVDPKQTEQIYVNYAYHVNYAHLGRNKDMFEAKRQKMATYEISHFDKVKEWKKKANFLQSRKSWTDKMKTALEWPELRVAEQAEVQREAPIAMARIVLSYVDQAAMADRHGVSSAKAKENIYNSFKIYKDQLSAWVDLNCRPLNVRAMMWTLYHYEDQLSVDEIFELIEAGKVDEMVAKYNVKHKIALAKRAQKAWAKLRFYVLCRRPLKVYKIGLWLVEQLIKMRNEPVAFDAKCPSRGKLWRIDQRELIWEFNPDFSEEQVEERLVMDAAAARKECVLHKIKEAADFAKKNHPNTEPEFAPVPPPRKLKRPIEL